MPTIADPIVTLAQAKAQLGIVSTDFDADLELAISSASQWVANKIGPVAGSPTVDEWHDGGGTQIVLRNDGPIQSVTSVTESWGSIDYTLTEVTLDSGSLGSAFEFTADLNLGLIVRRAAGAAVRFAPGKANIHVTFVAGYATVPDDIVTATLLYLQYQWETRRGPSQRPGRGPSPSMSPGEMYGRAMELLSSYMPPGIA